MLNELLGAAIVTGVVVAGYNAYGLRKYFSDGVEGAAPSSFQEELSRYPHSYLIDEVYLWRKMFWTTGGVAIAGCFALLIDD